MRKKLLISFLTVLIVGFTITGLISINLIKDAYQDNLEEMLTSSGRMLSNLFAEEYSSKTKNYNDTAKYYSSVTGDRITIIGANGEILGDSSPDKQALESYTISEEVREALAGGIGKAVRYSTARGVNMLYTAVPVRQGNTIPAVIRVSVSLPGVFRMQRRYLAFALMVVVLCLISSAAVTYSLINSLAKPIKEITEASSRIASGEYEKRIKLDSNDEIGELAESFNNMAKKLEITINDLSDKKNKLEAILTSMDSGVIAVDCIGKVMLVNPAALEILGFKENILGRHIFEIFRNNELEDIISSHRDENKEIWLGYPQKRVLRVKATPISDEHGNECNHGVVVVMHDITELKQLEKVRTEFVANVSHELRTPLTSIKGFAETLREGAINDEKTKEKFLDIINVEADRLNRLISDILSLSELENKKSNIIHENVDINKAVGEIEEMMNGLSKSKNINLVFEKGDGIPKVPGVHDKVKQLLINLIDNAIKYTPDGGSVNVSTYYSDKHVYIKVSDTGIGISKEHLARLFERFYRVDKGRSRALGGTGLGLAIVKHIASSMGGSVSVKSEPGKGSIFTVDIPEK